MPTGPGSIAGMGESFDVQLNTGTLTFSVPFQVPPGVSGLQPTLALVHNPGIANGPFGPGWALSLSGIQRKTDDGQPLYTTEDKFVDSSGEELLLMTDGTCRREFELDGQFARVERLGDGWRQTSKSGQVRLFGQYPNGSDSNRVSRVGRNDSSFNETFAWLLDELADVNGNRIHFYYTNFADSPGSLYLAEVRYSVFGTNFHSVQFDYDPRVDCESSQTNRAGLADYTAGFARIWGRRCAAIRIYTSGAAVRRYTFDYALSPGEEPVPPATGAMATHVSRLRKVTQWDSTFTNFLPPLCFSYTEYASGGARTTLMTNNPGWYIATPGHSGIDLFDVNSDGLPDLLNGNTAGAWRYSQNRAGAGFDGRQTLMTNSPGYSLSSSSAQIIDFNSDGLADFANKSSISPSGRYVYWLYQGKGRWEGERVFSSNPPFAYNDPNIAVLDLDFDKDMDVLYFHTGGQIAWFQQDGHWTETSRSWGNPALGDVPSTLRLSQSNVRLVDLNGDRLLDLVELTRVSPWLEVRYWPNMGRGAFGRTRQFARTLYNHGDLNNLYFLDSNGDGLADLVKVLTTSEVQVWLNLGDGTWGAPFSVSAPSFGTSVSLRFADMNANGSTDILYCNTTLGQYRSLDFIGTNEPPGLLKAIDNGMGKRTLVQYASVASFMTQAEQAGHPWTLTLPFAMQVVSGFDVQIGKDLDGIPGNDRYVTRIRYRDPFYDAGQKELRGFAFVEKTEHGDEYWGITNGASPGRLTRIAYHVGAPDGLDNDGNGQVDEMHGRHYEENALKGMILWSEVADVGAAGTETWPYSTNSFLPDARVYSRSWLELGINTTHGTNGALLPLLPADPSREVRFPVVRATVNEVVEKGAGPKRVIRTVSDYDAYGNLARKEEWGDVTPGFNLDDERFTFTTYHFSSTQGGLGAGRASNGESYGMVKCTCGRGGAARRLGLEKGKSA